MKKIAIIFDMDGVLVDSNPFHKLAILQFCTKYNKNLSDEELRKHIWGRTNREWIGHLFENKITDAQIQDFAVEKEALFRSLYEKDIVEVKGLSSFLSHLHSEHIPIAIGTSAPPANVQFVFEKTGIGHFFNTVLDETFVTHGKPNPEIYLKVAKALNFDPKDCIVFEDSLSGVEAAQRAGCKVVGLTTTHTAEELKHTNYIIQDFTNLKIEDLMGIF